ncbi:MAG: hypothetical protein R2784_08865 [Saprospiraceae bacterium]
MNLALKNNTTEKHEFGMDIRYFLHLDMAEKMVTYQHLNLSAVAAFLLMSRLPETYKS